MVRQLTSPMLADQLIGASQCMQQLRDHIACLAAYDVNALLQGESGTGKELVSRILHQGSRRGDGPFVGVNCAAIHESLLESELFGHEAGAFTGATHATVGFFRAADGGTILLDEVTDMGGPLQSKLLRVLEERAVVPVGGTRPVPIDVRVIAATHEDLGKAVAEGSFRPDLYYRLNVVRLDLPPLRQRLGDVPALAEHMLATVSETLRVPPKSLSPSALEALIRYDWPGNIRELRNVIERAYVLSPGQVIGVDDLPEELRDGDRSPTGAFPTLDEAMGRHVRGALELSGGVRRRAARMLAIDRKRLRRMMCHYGLV
jgi:two-component system response regulator HydG